ncbi:prepilin peptidase [Cetobacterium sp. 8H]|uniref:prepilin peptidase n=1 Tax=Cetobacterium sp. 8H TaxID=2759681 RepID=UPI00163C2FA4|nr:A24 family peptidase [Cetobacterium sp. 8H]MBC2851095.1 prepilin peptidase [Cetobacterium sp. 8H]
MDQNVVYLIIYLCFLSIIKKDIEERIIPNKYCIFLLILGLILGEIDSNISKKILGACVYASPFMLIYGYGSDFLGKECLGFGDVKLAFSIGSLIGFQGLYQVLVYLNLTFIGATIFSILYYILKKEKIKEIALGPFLILAYIYQSVDGFYV